MRKKHLLSILTVCTMVIGLFAGCGSDTKTGNTSKNKNSKQETISETENQTDNAEQDTSASDGKTLVVYYSASGRTKAVAETIAKTANADLFEITPVEPYTDADLDWTDSKSRVNKEHDDESLRDIELTQVTLDNWDSYDTIFVGYPIWWGIAAWPVDNFVKGNDFTDKTVIPFCTSASSGLGESGDLLKEMAGTGDWQEGQRFSSNASESDVENWVQSLNLNWSKRNYRQSVQS